MFQSVVTTLIKIRHDPNLHNRAHTITWIDKTYIQMQLCRKYT